MAIAFQTLDGLGRAGERRRMPHFINVVNPQYKEIACSFGTKRAVNLFLKHRTSNVEHRMTNEAFAALQIFLNRQHTELDVGR
jgi:hypothetical protein